MRRLVTLEQLLRQAEESGEDLRDIGVDRDDLVNLTEIDDFEANPDAADDTDEED